MKTVIMAGGKGTRISNLFPGIPKPMIPISRINEEGVEEKKPVLEWEIESLRSQGFTDIILTVSCMHEKLEEYFGNGSRLGVSIEYFVEDIPLGNAGALFFLRQKLGDEPFLLLNADAVFDIDFNRFISAHMEHKQRGGLVTLFTHPNSHPYDSGLIIATADGAVEGWLAKEDARPEWYKNRVNAGLHVIDLAVIDMSGIDVDTIGLLDENGKPKGVDLDRQILKPLCGSGRMYCYDSPEYVKDMGTPERFYSVQHDFETGVVQQKNLSHKQKAIFLDRDGTINKYVGFLREIDEFELLPGVAEAVKMINASGYLCVVITNQPVIARGEVMVSELGIIHNKMETLLGAEGAYIDGLYYCPHHPDKGFEGEVEALKFECDCRKPKPGLIFRAAEDFNIDLASSWMIGDGENDVKAGQAAGCRTALIGENEGSEPDVVANNLLEVVEAILGK